MHARLALAALAVAFVGCANDLGGPEAATESAGRTERFTGGTGDTTAPPRNVDATPDEEGDEAPPPAVEEPDAEPPAEEDPDGDGAVFVSDEAPVPPSEAQQACSEWTDCGPHYVNENSGFDCVSDVCVCDNSGQWADACAQIDGFWSYEDCFCYVGTSPMPTAQATPPPEVAAEDDDVTCWWRWKDLGCDPDRWIDRSYYEEVCDSNDNCWDEYVHDGYWIDGDCHGRWVKRCSDGYEYW